MKHAGAAALDDVEALLLAVRETGYAKERSRGVFYAKGTAVLHFHEDPAGIFADVRLGEGWSRMRVSTVAERRRFVSAVRRAWSGSAARPARKG